MASAPFFLLHLHKLQPHPSSLTGHTTSWDYTPTSETGLEFNLWKPFELRLSGHTFSTTMTVIPRKKRPQQTRPILLIQPGRTSGGNSEWLM